MRDKTQNVRFATAPLAIAVSCLCSVLLFGEDGRNFAGSFEIRNALNRAQHKYEQWSAGAIPKLVISFTDASGEQVRSEVELRPEFLGELPKRELPFASAPSPAFNPALQDNTAASSGGATCPVGTAIRAIDAELAEQLPDIQKLQQSVDLAQWTLDRVAGV